MMETVLPNCEEHKAVHDTERELFQRIADCMAAGSMDMPYDRIQASQFYRNLYRPYHS